MPLEPIRRNQYEEPDRQEVQERVASAVEANPETFLAAYCALPNSFGGRYVCADLFKETFADYAASPADRNRYNSVVHNSAAVLASEHYRRVVSAPGHPEQDAAVFLTGSPGAGKTTSVVLDGSLGDRTRVVYEGQLSDPSTAIPKLELAINAGLTPAIIAVHPEPEMALENTFKRFDEYGRGASVATMAKIQGTLPDGLAAIRDRFGDDVTLVVIDRRPGVEPDRYDGWQNLDRLASEGSREQIEQRLIARLEQHHAGGTITDACYRQARGLAPAARDLAVDRSDRDRLEASRDGQRVPRRAGQADLLIQDSVALARTASTPAELARIHYGMRSPSAVDVYRKTFGEHADRRSQDLAEKHGQTLARAFKDQEPRTAAERYPELRSAYAMMARFVTHAESNVAASERSAYVKACAERITKQLVQGKHVPPLSAVPAPQHVLTSRSKTVERDRDRD